VIFFCGLKNKAFILPFNLEFFAYGEILSYSWRKYRFFHEFLEMFLHLLFFFSLVRIALFFLWLPTSEMSSKLFLIVKFRLIYFEYIHPHLIWLCLFVMLGRSESKLFESLMNFLEFFVLFVLFFVFLLLLLFVFLVLFLYLLVLLLLLGMLLLFVFTIVSS
jgi:hypothetical protein